MKTIAKLLAIAALAVSAIGFVGGTSDANAAKAPNPCRLLLIGPQSADLIVCSAQSESVTIKNVGQTPAGPFHVRVSPGYRDLVGCADEAVPAYWRFVGSLGARTSVTIDIPWSSTDREVMVDYFNKVAEADELNNTAPVPGEGSRIC